jgi:hypothetical protein
LPKRDGVRPIQVYIDQNAPAGWRKALKRIVVRHLAFGDARRDAPQAGATSASRVSPAGVEPATCALGKHRSIQLSYGDAERGAG